MDLELKMARVRKIMMMGTVICLAGSGLCIAQKSTGEAGTAAQAADAKEWPTFGHDSGGMRFSPLTQINTGNVDKLTVAWTYHMKQEGDSAGGGRGPGGPRVGLVGVVRVAAGLRVVGGSGCWWRRSVCGAGCGGRDWASAGVDGVLRLPR